MMRVREFAQMKQGRQSVQAFRQLAGRHEIAKQHVGATGRRVAQGAAKRGLQEQQPGRRDGGLPVAEAASRPGKGPSQEAGASDSCRAGSEQQVSQSAQAVEAQAPPPAHHTTSEECLPIPVVIVIQVFVIIVTVLVLRAGTHSRAPHWRWCRVVTAEQ